MTFLESGIYQWLILPLLIFASRVLDVSLGTVRLVFVARGYKYLAPLIGFFEILIWILAVGQIMQNLANPACYIGYSGGFALGNYVGMWIAERLSLGTVMVRVVTSRETSQLMAALSALNFGVTQVGGKGAQGDVNILFTIIPRRKVLQVIDKVKQFNPHAFYTIEEVTSVQQGVFPEKKPSAFNALSQALSPMRKGK